MRSEVIRLGIEFIFKRDTTIYMQRYNTSRFYRAGTSMSPYELELDDCLVALCQKDIEMYCQDLKTVGFAHPFFAYTNLETLGAAPLSMSEIQPNMKFLIDNFTDDINFAGKTLVEALNIIGRDINISAYDFNEAMHEYIEKHKVKTGGSKKKNEKLQLQEDNRSD